MGLCSWADPTQECAAASERDCADSDICKTSGICGFVEGKCVARNDADCRGSEQCQERGMCHFDADLQPPCGAGSDEDCAASSRCRQLGACTARLRKCVVADGDCRTSQACIVHGRCSEHTYDAATRCVAGSNADCKDSTDCTDRGLCLAKDGVCI